MSPSSVIPGPNNPQNKIDVFLQPLIDELKTLWNKGVDTYDIHANQTFKMKVGLMWTINDFPVYEMLSGWSTHGALSCPVCQDQIRDPTWSIDAKCRGLTIIGVSSHETMCLGGITMPSHEVEPCTVNHHND